MIGSLIGVISVWKKAGKVIEKNFHFLVSFSAGVFLVISYQLIVETFHIGKNLNYSMLWVFIGMIIIWTISKMIPEFHSHEDSHKNKLNSKKIILSDFFHNIGDGVLLTASFFVSSTLGILTALSILVHELIQEISEFFVLKGSGYSTKEALKINFLVSSSILIGSIGSFFLLETFEILEVPLLGIAGGAFLVVVLKDLIPHSVKDSISNKHHLKHIFWFIIGVIIMFFVSNQIFHDHSHDDHDDYHEESHEIHDDEDHHEDEDHLEEHANNHADEN